MTMQGISLFKDSSTHLIVLGPPSITIIITGVGLIDLLSFDVINDSNLALNPISPPVLFNCELSTSKK